MMWGLEVRKMFLDTEVVVIATAQEIALEVSYYVQYWACANYLFIFFSTVQIT
jgi:hypothetical protein